MRRQRNLIKLTLVVSIFAGILLPLALGAKDPTLIAITFSSVWAIYSIILLGYVFLIEGRHRGNKSKRRKEEDPLTLHSIQEWPPCSEATDKRYKDPGMGNPDWN